MPAPGGKEFHEGGSVGFQNYGVEVGRDEVKDCGGRGAEDDEGGEKNRAKLDHVHNTIVDYRFEKLGRR